MIIPMLLKASFGMGQRSINSQMGAPIYLS